MHTNLCDYSICCKSTCYVLMAFVLWGAPESFSVVNMCLAIISKSSHNHAFMICIEFFTFNFYPSFKREK